MTRLFHSLAGLSIGVAIVATTALWPARAATSPYYGRWTVSDESPLFSTRGKLYKTIDIAPCGKDFCGVSVGDSRTCGPILFRFLAKYANGEGLLHGHGVWGKTKKNIQIEVWRDDEGKGMMQLYLGDGYDFGDRSANMPKFQAGYQMTGRASCTAR